MNGNDLYDVWAAALASEGIENAAWQALAGVEQHAWDELAAFISRTKGGEGG